MNNWPNIALIVLDSLRYDTAIEAKTPHFDFLGKWQMMYAQATFTLPAHIAALKCGYLPMIPGQMHPRFFRIMGKQPGGWRGEVKYELSIAPNIPKAFAQLKYRTIGLGGVTWFDPQYETTPNWYEYFNEYYFRKEWHQNNREGFKNQVTFLKTEFSQSLGKKLFLFVNVSTTHHPYRGNPTHQGQIKAMEYIDTKIARLVDWLPRPCHLIIFADHGDCHGEDGLWWHGFYHPKIMEVPYMEVLLT